mgnify:CR=1 FL=1
MTLEQLLQGVAGAQVYGDKDTVLTGVCYHSGKLQPGNVFVAVRGLRSDGHTYLQSAVENGAAAVIVEKFQPGLPVPQAVVPDSRKALAQASANWYGNPSKSLRLVGVTGTNGKTTVTYLVKEILERAGRKVGLIGTNQNMVGNMVLKSDHTTPESLELQELFSIMVREQVDDVVMEVSSHSLALNRIYGCHFAVAAFTNLTQDHLDFHGTMEQYMAAKAKLFQMCDMAVVNGDDMHVDRLLAQSSCPVVRYGEGASNDICAKNIVLHARGVEFSALDQSFSLPIPGHFSVYNALCAIGICRSLGVGAGTICQALKTAHGVKGRAELVDVPTDFTVMIDYAHSPDGLENILKTVRGFCKGRLIVLFGCGGDRDKTKRPMMGELAGSLADFCIVTSDNPRTEEPEDIINDILPGVKKTKVPYEVVVNRRDAIAFGLALAKKDDVLLLAGKGHETYQVLKDGVIDFDERQIVRSILQNQGRA